MFMRVSTYRIAPSRLQEMDAKVDEVRAKLSGLAGLKHASVGRDDDGNAAVIAVWESKSAADAAEATVTSVWGSMSHLMSAPPDRRGFDTHFHLAGHSF